MELLNISKEEKYNQVATKFLTLLQKLIACNNIIAEVASSRSELYKYERHSMYSQYKLELDYLEIFWEYQKKATSQSIADLLGTDIDLLANDFLPCPNLKKIHLDTDKAGSTNQRKLTLENKIVEINKMPPVLAQNANISFNLRVNNINATKSYYLGVSFRKKINNWVSLVYNGDYDSTFGKLKNNYSLQVQRTLSSETDFYATSVNNKYNNNTAMESYTITILDQIHFSI